MEYTGPRKIKTTAKSRASTRQSNWWRKHVIAIKTVV